MSTQSSSNTYNFITVNEENQFNKLHQEAAAGSIGSLVALKDSIPTMKKYYPSPQDAPEFTSLSI